MSRNGQQELCWSNQKRIYAYMCSKGVGKGMLLFTWSLSCVESDAFEEYRGQTCKYDVIMPSNKNIIL